MQLTKSQANAVAKLLAAFRKRKESKSVAFKAPTGAGKTFIASEFIASAFASEYGKAQKMVVVVATISNAHLPKQFARKLEDYKNFHHFNDYQVEHIESPSNTKASKVEAIPEFVLAERKVFVFGTSSFGKRTLFYQNRTLDTFLQQASNQSYEIIFIRDEAHIGKKESISMVDLKTFDNKMNASANFVLEMTATPKSNRNLVEMTIEDMSDDGRYLLKSKVKKTNLVDEVTNEEIIDDAIATFKKSKWEYQKLGGVMINPAMLIQVMNEANYKRDPVKNIAFNEALSVLERKLSAAGLKYLKYVQNPPEVIGTKVPNTLEYAAHNTSEIDAVIFKIGPATGWDIPRANMLLQLRSVSSERLNMQTLGRIMRNPYPGLKMHPTTSKYYVWSNYRKPARSAVFYKLEERFLNENFISGVINRQSSAIQNDDKLYKQQVIKWLRSAAFQNGVRNLNVQTEINYETTSYGAAVVKHKILNHIYLKIENYKNQMLYENELKISFFENELGAVAKRYNLDIEIIKYVFFKSISKIKDIKSQNTTWIHNRDAYELNETARPLAHYNIWKDNKQPKQIKTSRFINYGYKLISLQDENVQFLDSEPELKFFAKFRDVLSTRQLEKISFFAKMPTLGSQVFYEYYSPSNGRIAKSFMDFAIKYKNKVIMVEVKSYDEDYDKAKTSELLNAYRMYMEKFNQKNISLFLYQYNKKNQHSPRLYGYVDSKWKDNISFRDLTDKILG